MVMKPVHEINIDIVRLIEATERLLITGEPSARGGWQHWPRFCKFLKTLGELRAELQSRLLEDNDHDHTSQTTIYHTRPSAEDLATYDTRVETLRRKRDDLLAAAAAASATDGCDESSTLLSSPASDIDEIKAASSPNEQVVHSITGSSSSTHNIKTASRVRSNDRDHGKRGSRTGKQAWRTGRGAENAEQKAEAAQADEVAHEIATMASKLKESSMAINKTLRTQTQVLEDTGDAAAENVDSVKRENKRVSDRLNKKRAAMIASWCMMLTVVVTFFVTYALVIVPFEKRRGPFVKTRPSGFAHAVEAPVHIPSQQHNERDASADAETAEIASAPRATLSSAVHRQAIEEQRRRAGQFYEERAQRKRQTHGSASEDLLLVAEEEEKHHQRHDERINQEVEDSRGAKAKASVETEEERRGAASEKVLPSQEQREGANEDEARNPAAFAGSREEQLELSKMYRRRAQESYMERAKQVRERQQATNADMRHMAEEKEKYRQRQGKRMMQGADERRRIMADVEAHREGELRSTTTDDTRQEGKNDVTGQSDAGVVHERENEL